MFKEMKMRQLQKRANAFVNSLEGKSDKEVEQAYLDTIGILRQTVEAKDPYTRGHSDRVSEYSVLIGKKMGLDEQTLHTLKIGRIIS